MDKAKLTPNQIADGLINGLCPVFDHNGVTCLSCLWENGGGFCCKYKLFDLLGALKIIRL